MCILHAFAIYRLSNHPVSDLFRIRFSIWISNWILLPKGDSNAIFSILSDGRVLDSKKSQSIKIHRPLRGNKLEDVHNFWEDCFFFFEDSLFLSPWNSRVSPASRCIYHEDFEKSCYLYLPNFVSPLFLFQFRRNAFSYRQCALIYFSSIKFYLQASPKVHTFLTNPRHTR